MMRNEVEQDKKPTDYALTLALLKQLKLIECDDECEISPELQTLIKAKLLDLPELCQGLAKYYGVYNTDYKDNPVQTGYRDEVLHELKQQIPALFSVKLKGVRNGFISATMPKSDDMTQLLYPKQTGCKLQ